MKNRYNWPPLYVAYIAVCFHYTIALSLAMDTVETRRILAVGGLDPIIDFFGVTSSIIFLVVISTLTVVGLVFEFHFKHWQTNLVLILPQYLVVITGAGYDVNVLIQGEYRDNEISRWLIISGLSLFFWVAVWHTFSILARIKYWMLLSLFHSEA